jgi:hypothetical protein
LGIIGAKTHRERAAIEGIMLVWFVLTGLSLAFVVVDIPKTPESTVLKWAFVILALFTGPFGAFFYVLGCREPLNGTHERYVSTTWRQVLGSTTHCAAGDGIGIIAGAAVGAHLYLSPWGDFALEYVSGGAKVDQWSGSNCAAAWRSNNRPLVRLTLSEEGGVGGGCMRWRLMPRSDSSFLLRVRAVVRQPVFSVCTGTRFQRFAGFRRLRVMCATNRRASRSSAL